jgi:hypothetical protein
MAQITWRTIHVHSDGTIDYVSKMSATTGDGVFWFVENPNPFPIKLKVREFHKKSSGQDVDPIDFCADSCDVSANGRPGLIGGQLVFLPSSSTTVTLKYTISVKVNNSGAWIDTDPDLDVNRP